MYIQIYFQKCVSLLCGVYIRFLVNVKPNRTTLEYIQARVN